MKKRDFFASTVDESWIDSTITAFNNLQYDITDRQTTKWKRGQKNKKNMKNNKIKEKENKNSNNNTDRFIPIRDEHKFDQQQTYQEKEDQNDNNNNNNTVSNNNDDDHKILSFQTKAPEASDGYISNLRTLYRVNNNNNNKNKNNNNNRNRHISSSAERVLDAPDIMDDFYLNLLDWSKNNIIAIGLGSSCYFWNSENGEINLLNDFGENIYICSVAFNHNGQYIAIGTSNNILTLYDTKTCKTLRKLYGHSCRISSLSWNHSILSTGSADSTIRNNDVRKKEYHISTFGGNGNVEQEICGLKWNNNLNGKYLASGSNDNKLCIWSLKNPLQPIYEFTESLSAIKGISWCPWNNNLIASGGGSGDRKIRIYDISITSNGGNLINECDTESQVTSLIWNPFEKELLSSHGFSKNQLSIWKYPSLNKTHDLIGHTSRILYTALSPNGQMVVSAAADETLRFWNVFENNNNNDNNDSKQSIITHSNLSSINKNKSINGLNLAIR